MLDEQPRDELGKFESKDNPKRNVMRLTDKEKFLIKLVRVEGWNIRKLTRTLKNYRRR